MKNDLNRLYHMIDAINEMLDFSENKERKDLEKDKMLSYSLIHLLEVVGEAANGVTSEFQNKYPNIPWEAIIGMRHRLIHGYFDIDLDIVWKTVNKDIPELKKEVKQVIESEK